MAIETRYVCDACGKSCSHPSNETFVLAVRRPPSGAVTTKIACCPGCYAELLKREQEATEAAYDAFTARTGCAPS